MVFKLLGIVLLKDLLENIKVSLVKVTQMLGFGSKFYVEMVCETVLETVVGKLLNRVLRLVE